MVNNCKHKHPFLSIKIKEIMRWQKKCSANALFPQKSLSQNISIICSDESLSCEHLFLGIIQVANATVKVCICMANHDGTLNKSGRASLAKHINRIKMLETASSINTTEIIIPLKNGVGTILKLADPLSLTYSATIDCAYALASKENRSSPYI